MLGKIFSRQHFEIFFSYFSLKTEFGISCKLFPNEMKFQTRFSDKKKEQKKNIISLSSTESAQRVVNHTYKNVVSKQLRCPDS